MSLSANDKQVFDTDPVLVSPSRSHDMTTPRSRQRLMMLDHGKTDAPSREFRIEVRTRPQTGTGMEEWGR